MRKLTYAALLLCLLLVIAPGLSLALDRQPNSDYHIRREALAKKAGGVIVLFAPLESEGPNDLYGFRQDDNFFYLTGLSEPGAALLIAPATEAKAETPASPYTEILFLPPRNLTQEKWIGPKLGPENPEAPRIAASIGSKTWESCPTMRRGRWRAPIEICTPTWPRMTTLPPPLSRLPS